VENRTAVFVFFIGDRLYGTVLAFVSLAARILKDVEPQLLP
jgi:hypothetical protein